MEDIIKPLVSICVASYNQAKYVSATLKSLVTQSYRPVEIIVVDDASTDNSVEVITSWIDNYYKTTMAEELCNIKFIAKDKNAGVCHTFNTALKNSTGNFISIIASDDIMMPEKLHTQVSLLKNASSAVGIVYSDAFIINDYGKRYFSRFIQWHRHFVDIPQGSIFETLLDGNFVPIMTVLFKKECFDKCGYFDENLIYEDYDMLLRISQQYEVVFSEYLSAEYRVHSDNLHKKLTSIKALESDFEIFSKHVAVHESARLKVKINLLNCIDKMGKAKSSRLSSYLIRFDEMFRGNRIIHMAAQHGIPYSKLMLARRIALLIKKLF